MAESQVLVSPGRYAKWRSSVLGRITENLEIRTVFNLAGNLEGKRILDIGTGNGTYALEASRRGLLRPFR